MSHWSSLASSLAKGRMFCFAKHALGARLRPSMAPPTTVWSACCFCAKRDKRIKTIPILHFAFCILHLRHCRTAAPRYPCSFFSDFLIEKYAVIRTKMPWKSLTGWHVWQKTAFLPIFFVRCAAMRAKERKIFRGRLIAVRFCPWHADFWVYGVFDLRTF